MRLQGCSLRFGSLRQQGAYHGLGHRSHGKAGRIAELALAARGLHQRQRAAHKRQQRPRYQAHRQQSASLHGPQCCIIGSPGRRGARLTQSLVRL